MIFHTRFPDDQFRQTRLGLHQGRGAEMKRIVPCDVNCGGRMVASRRVEMTGVFLAKSWCLWDFDENNNINNNEHNKK